MIKSTFIANGSDFRKPTADCLNTYSVISFNVSQTKIKIKNSPIVTLVIEYMKIVNTKKRKPAQLILAIHENWPKSMSNEVIYLTLR